MESRLNKEELQYLSLLKTILETGSKRLDRTGIGTLSIFGTQLRFSLENDTVPMLTTKKMFARGVIEELLFFLRGDTDTKKLEAKEVNIWKGNTSREFLDKRGLYDLEEGDMGKGYGYQWRKFGADEKKNIVGADQLTDALYLIKNDPCSRKIVVSAWNPQQISEMALEPCHCLFQFYVGDGKLSLHWYQRSADCGLGIPFNIASYAILTHLFAKAANLKPGELIFSGGDCHIYMNHIEQIKEQLVREPYPFPKLFIDKPIFTIEDMENLSFENFRVESYKHHPVIKMIMSA